MKKINYPQKKTKKRFIFFILFLFIIIAFFCFLILFEKKIIPVAVSISEKYAVTEINNQINKATEEVVSDMKVTQKDFFLSAEDEKNNSISINTLLINEVCSNLSVKISKKLNELPQKKLTLPLGIMTGLNMFSNLGPEYEVTITPMGSSEIDYETSFESVGINQINFQIYLNIVSEISIINPFYSKNVIIKRKLMLVNTIFNGEVPSTYMTLPKEN